jgi:hypothetical protein
MTPCHSHFEPPYLSGAVRKPKVSSHPYPRCSNTWCHLESARRGRVFAATIHGFSRCAIEDMLSLQTELMPQQSLSKHCKHEQVRVEPVAISQQQPNRFGADVSPVSLIVLCGRVLNGVGGVQQHHTCSLNKLPSCASQMSTMISQLSLSIHGSTLLS